MTVSSVGRAWGHGLNRSNPGRDGHGSHLCADSETISMFHSRVTTVARKSPLSFCHKCRWLITHNYTTPAMQPRGGLNLVDYF